MIFDWRVAIASVEGAALGTVNQMMVQFAALAVFSSLSDNRAFGRIWYL